METRVQEAPRQPLDELWAALAGAAGSKDGVASVIESAIRDGLLAKGYRLPTEREIALVTGLSRTTIRDSLSKLTDKGLIARHVGRGTFVSPSAAPAGVEPPAFTWDEMPSPREFVDFRRECEPSLAALVVMNASDAELKAIQAMALGGRQARTWDHSEAVDSEFHLRLYEASHNAVFRQLGRFLTSVRRGKIWLALKQQNYSPEGWQHYQKQHEQIMDLLLARDIKAAREAMRLHLDRVQGWVES